MRLWSCKGDIRMKKAVRVFALILALMTVLTVCTFAADEDEVNFLVLGDSITQGYGVANSSEAAYGRIVADTNGWNYENYARVAYDTSDMLYMLENYSWYRSAIKQADIINVCIGSNNYLANEDVVKIAAGALFHLNSRQLDEIADGIYEDYFTIYDEIRELNPDATLIFNNIYCAWKGLGHIIFSQAVERINAKLYAFAEAHPDVIIFDASSVITHNTELIADDCVHPNAAGNAALAKKMLELMKEKGFCENTEPVILTPGEDYNFYVEEFGKFGGTLLSVLIKILTGNLF